jgi:hypothetical protein
MLTSFGFYYLIGTLAFALFLTTPVFYSELKWDFKKNILPYLGLTTFLFFGLLFITNFLGGYSVPIQKTEWRTIHPNEKKVTVAVKSETSKYITITSKTKQDDIKYTNKIKLTQGDFVKEKDIENVIVDGDGPILDKVQYGTETTQYAIFGKPILKHKGHRNALRFIYKEPASNKTLDDMLK